MLELLSKINWSPLFISLKTGFVAIIFIFILGVIGAIAVMKMSNRAKWVLDAIFTMPLVLPPTVAGYLLLLVFSLRRPFGMFLKNELGIKVVQSWSGCVGDVEKVNADFLATLIRQGIVPVMAPLTHDGQGSMLNTNADTIAGETAKALAPLFDVTLVYCFEKKGVLRDENDDDSVIPVITPEEFKEYVARGIIQGGMIPKLENSFSAIDAGVSQVVITLASAIKGEGGTIIKK